MHRHVLRPLLLLACAAALLWLVDAVFGRTAMLAGAVAAVIVAAYTYFNAGRVALRALHARQVSQAEHPTLYRLVRELSTQARQPMPSLYISPTEAPNAFSVGRNPRNAAICCTTGLLTLLDERQLRAVLAHELAHIHNRDTLVATSAATLAGAVTAVATAAAITGLFGDDDDDTNPIALLAATLIAPIAATVVRLAVSRHREFTADHTAATLTGDPDALASALRALDEGTHRKPLAPTPPLLAHSHLLIANPFGPARTRTTHPSTEARVARLKALTR